MLNNSFSKLIEQVVETLRDGMLSGRWKDTLPGRERLAEELGVSHATIEEAMRRLSNAGWLVSQGPGRRRKIILPEGNAIRRNLLVSILLYESVDRYSGEFIDLVEKLSKAEFTASVAPKSMLDLGMDVKRVARMVRQNPADVWIVVAGSREVLEWFSKQPMPVYAHFGRTAGLPIAGCVAHKDIPAQVKRLAELGHRRIVALARGDHSKPEPSLPAQRYLKALKDAGIEPSSYNLPEWGTRPDELRRCLKSLFEITPPTALFIDEYSILLAVRDFMAERGLLVPRDVSLICNLSNPLFLWCNPLLAHFSLDFYSINRRVVRWVKNIALGKDDRCQIIVPAKFIDGGSIGPAPKGTVAPQP